MPLLKLYSIPFWYTTVLNLQYIMLLLKPIGGQQVDPQKYHLQYIMLLLKLHREKHLKKLLKIYNT